MTVDAPEKQVEIYLKHLSEIDTVPALLQAVGDDVQTRWETLGQADGKIHWAYGREADALISEGAKVGIVCKAIAIKAGKSFETIRKAYYTYKRFTDTQRDQFHLCPYSIFQHAATTKRPVEVLQYYLDNRTSVEEIETVFPPMMDDVQKAFVTSGYPRIFYGVYREIYGLDELKRREAQGHIDALNKIIQEANQ